jgi:hypothetical protein
VATGDVRRAALYTVSPTGASLGDSLDGGATVISIASHSTGRQYTVPDAGGNADFVMSVGNQNIASTKTIGTSGASGTSGALIIARDASLLLQNQSANYISIKATNGNPGSPVIFVPFLNDSKTGSFAITNSDGLNISGFPANTQVFAGSHQFGTSGASSEKIGFFGTAPVSQQTGGAGTAGTGYTLNERDMLNKAYSALRNLGLIT